ncbi:uncharacterized protein LOC106636059 [Copidosoma floridanum]|uniref:uncharacterized protein LOC106636059 n=1 Tax=Copidosoma floridanum TaxID=29053 RepID=UPI0006C987E0|nr:uncharacterized protein LOC106636059 [Copidosoma floridanum]
MPPDSRSVSFIFHRDAVNARSTPDESKIQKNFRRRLQDKFDKEKVDGLKDRSDKDSSDKLWHNLSLGQVSTDSKKAFRSGADKISKTISSVRTTLGSISQKFKSSTRRRQRLEEQQSPTSSACKSQTPQSRSRNLLGRTPTKLYSPFGIESPRNAWGKENDRFGAASTPTNAFRESPEIGNCTSTNAGRRHRFFRLSKVNGFCALR